MGSRPIGHPNPPAPRDGVLTASLPLRVVVGLFAGVGATGIAASLGVAGTFLDIDVPLVDPSPLILMAPVVIVPAFAGAALRGWAAVGAITAGAGAAPIAFIFAIDRSCNASMFAAIGFVALAIYALLIAGGAAIVGDRLGRWGWLEEHRGRGVWFVIVVAMIGTLGWIAAVPALDGCP